MIEMSVGRHSCEPREAGAAQSDAHFHPGPEGLGGLMVPSVYDTASHMFAFGRGLFGACGFLDVDGELRLGSAHDCRLAAGTSLVAEK